MVQVLENNGPETQLSRNYTMLSYLEKSFLYKGMKPADLRKAGGTFSICKFKKGETIMQQGNVGDTIIMIVEGIVSFVVKQSDDKDKLLRKLGRFEVVGENCFVHDNHKFLASVLAFDEVTALRMNRDTYLKFENKVFMQPIKMRIEAARRVMIRNGIKKIPFMQGLDDDDLSAFALQSVPAGVSLTVEGEIGDKFFILLAGKVVVTVVDDLGLHVEIARMDPSESPVSFGERALVTEEPRNATITTLEKTTFFEIEKKNFGQIMTKNATVQKGVASIIHKASLGDYFANNIPIFSTMSLNNQRLLGVVATFKSFSQGEYVKREGELSQRNFYLIIGGRCEVFVGGELVNTLAEGDYFGEVGLVTNRVSSATVRVTDNGPMSCMAIASEDFQNILASEPAFLAQMRIRVEGANCTLEDLLQHPDGRRSFLEHCKQEYAKENVNFWQDVLALENIQQRRIRKSILKAMKVDPEDIRTKKGQMLFNRVNSIYKKYLEEGAPEEINLPADIRENLITRYNNNDFSFDMFEEAKASIYSLIEADNFQRYKTSDAFGEFIAEIGTYKRAVVQKIPFLLDE